MLQLRHLAVNIKGKVVIPDGDPHEDIRSDIEQEENLQNCTPGVVPRKSINPDPVILNPYLDKVAFVFGQYLRTLSTTQSYASEV